MDRSQHRPSRRQSHHLQTKKQMRSIQILCHAMFQILLAEQRSTITMMVGKVAGMVRELREDMGVEAASSSWSWCIELGQAMCNG